MSLSCTNKAKQGDASDKEVLTYTNPLPVQFGDPYVLLTSDSVYYMYGTGGGAKDGFCAYSSPDLVNWKPEGQVFQGNTSDSWGIANFWAPEVYYLDGKFYMFYSANERISVATANNPTGPFTQTQAEQVPFHDAGEIDTHLFIDDDGTKYLYYVRFTNGNEIWVAELNDDTRLRLEQYYRTTTCAPSRKKPSRTASGRTMPRRNRGNKCRRG